MTRIFSTDNCKGRAAWPLVKKLLLAAALTVVPANAAHAVYDGTLATEQPTGVLFGGDDTTCTGAQVEQEQCILTAAHCAKHSSWTAHPRGTTTAGLPVPAPPNPGPVAAIDSRRQLGSGGDEPSDQAQDLAILHRTKPRGGNLPADFYLLNLRPQNDFYVEGRVWRLYGRGQIATGNDPFANVREALMGEEALYADQIYGIGTVYFGEGNGGYYRLQPLDNGVGAPDTACAGDSGGPGKRGPDVRGVISGGSDESFGSAIWGGECGDITSNQITATSLNGNGDFLTFAVAQDCCVCIPPERAPFCHFDENSDYACYNGAACNEKGGRATDPDGKRMPFCHNPNCFDPPSGMVYDIPTHCEGGGGRPPPPPPPGDPSPPPEPDPSDPSPPPADERDQREDHNDRE